jgi:hypothetical protein
MLAKGRPADVKSGPWREIRIQVDVPLMSASTSHSYRGLTDLTLLVTLQILAAVRLRILTTPDSSDQLPLLYAGQPIPASLSIQTSFHWDENQDAGRQSYQMRFEIQEMEQDWLISGQTCGDFEAEVCLYPRLVFGRLNGTVKGRLDTHRCDNADCLAPRRVIVAQGQGFTHASCDRDDHGVVISSQH